MKTYHKFVEEFSGGGLGKVTQSGGGPDGLLLADFLVDNHVLDQHDGRIASRLHDRINEQGPGR